MERGHNRFSKRHKLCGKNTVQRVFTEGRSLFSHPLKCVYFFSEDDSRPDKEPIQVLVSVSKKIHKRAVKRNLLKRRMREAYRLNRASFGNFPTGRNLQMAFIYTSKEILDYETIERGILRLSQKIAKDLEKHNGVSVHPAD